MCGPGSYWLNKMDGVVLFSKTVVEQPHAEQSKLIRLFLLFWNKISFYCLTFQKTCESFIMERNSTLLIKLKGRLQEGRTGWRVYSSEYYHNHRAPNHHVNSAPSNVFLFHSELALLDWSALVFSPWVGLKTTHFLGETIQRMSPPFWF